MKGQYSEKKNTESTDTFPRKLILYNSNHTWDDVLNQLELATGYDMLHCEQIAIIAHTKGKAVVKSGDMDELEPVNSVLKEIRLITEIE